jgi:hypothetical protein
MDSDSWRRLRGLTRLLHDGVRHGTDFVEKHHRHTAAKPFAVLESIPPLAAPTKAVQAVHDAVLWLTYGGIRAVNHGAELLDGWIVDRLAPPHAGSQARGGGECRGHDPERSVAESLR